VTVPFPRLEPLGDRALLVVLGDQIAAPVHRRVLALRERLERSALPGLVELVPAYASVTIHYDPLATGYDALAERVREALGTVETGEEAPPGRLVTIPLHYDGPDLGEVAARTGRPRAEVIERHAGREYRVYLLGFVPGFAYLGDLDPVLALPRRSEPRTRVPAGAVAIAGAQTGIYPFSTPGGWHLIGTTSLRLFDPTANPPVRLQVGDRVRFVPQPP
jgi:KipI family sensor histidine kinase inhibitor